MESRGPLHIMADGSGRRCRLRPEARQFYAQHVSGTGVAQALQLGDFTSSLPPPAKPARKRAPRDFVRENVAKLFAVPKKNEASCVPPAVCDANLAVRLAQLNVAHNLDEKHDTATDGNKQSNGKAVHLAMPNGDDSVSDAQLNGNGDVERTPEAPRASTSTNAVRPRPPTALRHRPSSAGAGAAAAKDFVRLNIESAGSAVRRSPSTGAAGGDGRQRPAPGALPHYLWQRRKWLDERKADAERQSTGAPPGHRLMADEERRATLGTLKHAEKDLWVEWNKLPVRSDTMERLRCKMDMEMRMDEVRQAIDLFSKPTVFISNEAGDEHDE